MPHFNLDSLVVILEAPDGNAATCESSSRFSTLGAAVSVRRDCDGSVTMLRDGRELPVGLSVEGEEPVPDDRPMKADAEAPPCAPTASLPPRRAEGDISTLF